MRYSSLLNPIVESITPKISRMSLRILNLSQRGRKVLRKNHNQTCKISQKSGVDHCHNLDTKKNLPLGHLENFGEFHTQRISPKNERLVKNEGLRDDQSLEICPTGVLNMKNLDRRMNYSTERIFQGKKVKRMKSS